MSPSFEFIVLCSLASVAFLSAQSNENEDEDGPNWPDYQEGDANLNTDSGISINQSLNPSLNNISGEMSNKKREKRSRHRYNRRGKQYTTPSPINGNQIRIEINTGRRNSIATTPRTRRFVGTTRRVLSLEDQLKLQLIRRTTARPRFVRVTPYPRVSATTRRPRIIAATPRMLSIDEQLKLQLNRFRTTPTPRISATTRRMVPVTRPSPTRSMISRTTPRARVIRTTARYRYLGTTPGPRVSATTARPRFLRTTPRPRTPAATPETLSIDQQLQLQLNRFKTTPRPRSPAGTTRLPFQTTPRIRQPKPTGRLVITPRPYWRTTPRPIRFRTTQKPRVSASTPLTRIIGTTASPRIAWTTMRPRPAVTTRRPGRPVVTTRRSLFTTERPTVPVVGTTSATLNIQEQLQLQLNKGHATTAQPVSVVTQKVLSLEDRLKLQLPGSVRTASPLAEDEATPGSLSPEQQLQLNSGGSEYKTESVATTVPPPEPQREDGEEEDAQVVVEINERPKEVPVPAEDADEAAVDAAGVVQVPVPEEEEVVIPEVNEEEVVTPEGKKEEVIIPVVKEEEEAKTAVEPMVTAKEAEVTLEDSTVDIAADTAADNTELAQEGIDVEGETGGGELNAGNAATVPNEERNDSAEKFTENETPEPEVPMKRKPIGVRPMTLKEIDTEEYAGEVRYRAGFPRGTTLDSLLPEGSDGAEWKDRVTRAMAGCKKDDRCYWGQLKSIIAGDLDYLARSLVFFYTRCTVYKKAYCPDPCQALSCETEENVISTDCSVTEKGLYDSNYKCLCEVAYQWDEESLSCTKLDNNMPQTEVTVDEKVDFQPGAEDPLHPKTEESEDADASGEQGASEEDAPLRLSDASEEAEEEEEEEGQGDGPLRLSDAPGEESVPPSSDPGVVAALVDVVQEQKRTEREMFVGKSSLMIIGTVVVLGLVAAVVYYSSMRKKQSAAADAKRSRERSLDRRYSYDSRYSRRSRRH